MEPLIRRRHPVIPSREEVIQERSARFALWLRGGNRRVGAGSSRVDWLSDLVRLEIVLWERVDGRLRERHGLPLAFFESLHFISLATESGLRIGDLAGALGITVGGTSKVVDRIEAAGLIARGADPDDRRAARVTLTPEGRRMLKAAFKTYSDEVAALIDPRARAGRAAADARVRHPPARRDPGGGTSMTRHDARRRARCAGPARGAAGPRAADPGAEARVGAHRGQGLRAEPLGAAHPARARRWRHVPARARHRGHGRRRGGTGRRVRARPAGRGDDGRHGPHVRRRVRRVHLRPREPGDPVRLRARLGDARRGPRDAADRPRVAHRRPRRAAGPDAADPRRHLVGRHGRRGPGQGPRPDRRCRPPAAPSAPARWRRSASTT